MGYDTSRFDCSVDEELICPICSGVLEDALQAPVCEHAFCSSCIKEWLSRQNTCPVDRQPVTSSQLKCAPRILRNLLSRLNIECDNAVYGCKMIVKLDYLQNHCNECDFNPKKPVPCDSGCGLIVPKDELKDHNCVRDLRSYVEKQSEQISKLQQHYNDMKREVNMLKDCVRAIRAANPNGIPAIVESFEHDEVDRWTNSLQRARVTRWGGMISTPDVSLQESVRKALIDSSAPLHIITELMENSHERRWPPGLSTLEIRQMNRRLYDNYVCRRIPGRQAVVVMSSDNQHMNEDMLLEPGLVMIFAHGIE
ncbi:E3 ubiquitin-protein ligase NRDP1-like [Oppia nitens]|uniref:E3 ubiquitin-protein ligase NRDP1-like n=1 Tax=Oppia nitens TaxID=1686743 RepID=UPI0023DB1A85|nr:E3 ubiquitin-protein ligase NRDP1-like [Oppia nitens]XP_054168372.1 E3 ubiquitin-protein ligase NRDP1-like [Oppia nitens]